MVIVVQRVFPDGGPVGAGPGPVGLVPPGGVLPDVDGDGVPDGVSVPELSPGIPPVEEWPFRVYRPGDVSRDGPVDGGYAVPLNPRNGVLPRDPMWREMFEEHQRQAQARAGNGLGGLATAAGVTGLAAAGGRAGLGAGAGGARGMGGMPMGGMGGGAGSEEKDKGRRRRKYGKSGVEFFSMSDPVDPGAAAGEGDAAGARLIDAPQREEGDRW